MILVRFSLFVDANCEFLPRGVVNFVAKTVIGRMWIMFLKVAEEVRDGKRSSPARDCKELFEHNPKLEDGTYWVDPDGMNIPFLLTL